MRGAADFAAYLTARWPLLVRSLVLIGSPRAEAEAIVRTGMAQSYAGWDRTVEVDDVDTYAYRAVLDCWHRSSQRRSAEPGGTPAEIVPDEDATDLELLRRALEVELSRLTAVDREVLVLRFVAGLTEAQLADVLDLRVTTARSRVTQALAQIELRVGGAALALSDSTATEVFRRASESIDVLSPPLDDIVAEAVDRRRRRRRRTLAGVVAVVLVVGVSGWALSRRDGDPPSPWPVVLERNPVDVAWYAAGRLHLATATVEVPPIGGLAGVAEGAVITDARGRLSFVSDDGTVSELGRQAPDAGIVVSDENDWVAWVEPAGSGDEGHDLVVRDLGTGREVGRLDLADAGEVIAIDQSRVYYATSEGAFVWQSPDRSPARLQPSGLLDLQSGTRVYTAGAGRVEIVQSFFNASHLRAGTGAMVSPGGSFVLSHAGHGDGAFVPLLYDARTGEQLPSGLARGELALDAAFGPFHTVSYLVVPEGGRDGDGSSVLLRTCGLTPVLCHDVLSLPRTDERPMLGH